MIPRMDATSNSKLYSVGELARELDITPRALRFYEDKQLIAPRRVGNARVYTHRDRGRLILILRGKRLGFTLREIREWLDLYEADPRQVRQIGALTGKVDERIAVLEQKRQDIDATIAELRQIAFEAESYLATRGGNAKTERQ